MATRISLIKNPSGPFQAWMCKHSSHAAVSAEYDGHVVLCERCASAVGNGAELLNDENGQPIQTGKVTTVKVAKRAAAGK